jgi:hypothetical protein
LCSVSPLLLLHDASTIAAAKNRCCLMPYAIIQGLSLKLINQRIGAHFKCSDQKFNSLRLRTH